MRANKHTKRKSSKALILLISILAILVVGAGATIAYLATSTGPIENKFLPTQVTCDVIETFKNNVKSDVKVKNTSTEGVPAFIRAEIIVNWVDSEGNVLAKKPILGEDYALSINATPDSVGGQWITDSNFYYYTKPIDSGAETGVLISECKPLKACSEEGYTLSVEVIASAIQTTPYKAIEESWNGVEIKNGTLNVGQ